MAGGIERLPAEQFSFAFGFFLEKHPSGQID
jgi:hypothetical protein